MFLLLFASCESREDCVDERLELWCFHEENAEGPEPPTPDAVCDPPELTEAATTCGDYRVEGFRGPYVSEYHFFLEGEHVATRYTTDFNHYCGGFAYWYGTAIECDD